MYHHVEDFGISAEWHFFPTAHGKGPCDGVRGTVKRMAARANLQLPPDQQITTVRELYECASKPSNLPNVIVKFSPQEAYDTAKNMLASRFDSGKQIQKLHCVILQNDGFVSVKQFSRPEKSETITILKKKLV